MSAFFAHSFLASLSVSVMAGLTCSTQVPSPTKFPNPLLTSIIFQQHLAVQSLKLLEAITAQRQFKNILANHFTSMRTFGAITSCSPVCLYLLISFFFFKSFHFLLVTNKLPPAILLDYSCIDNLETKVLQNSYHRTCSNYAQIAAYVYATYPPSSSTPVSSKIYQVVKRNHEDHSTIKINSFRQLLKYRNIPDLLVRLFNSGGIWSFNIESTYTLLAKCKIEHVNLLFSPLIPLYPSHHQSFL